MFLHSGLSYNSIVICTVLLIILYCDLLYATSIILSLQMKERNIAHLNPFNQFLV